MIYVLNKCIWCHDYPYYVLYLQITRTDIRRSVKKTVTLVTVDGHFSLLQGFVTPKVIYCCCVLIEEPRKTHFLHCAKKPVTTMLTYPWKCTVLHCNHLGNTWKPLVLMTRLFDCCPSASEGDNQSVRSSAPVVSRCFPGGYNVKLYISRGRLAWWLLAFLYCVICSYKIQY